MNVVAYTEHPIREDRWTGNRYKVRKLIRYTSSRQRTGSGIFFSLSNSTCTVVGNEETSNHSPSFVPSPPPIWVNDHSVSDLEVKRLMMDSVKVARYQVSLGKVDKHISLYRREEESSWLNWSEVDRMLISWTLDVRIVSPRIILLHNLSRKPLGVQAKQSDKLKHIAVRFPPSLARL